MACEHCGQRKTRAQERREQVLDAAQACFRRNGFHGASMAQISKEVGMSPGHIYNYFESKEAIIDAIVARDHEEILEAIGGIEKADGDVLDAMAEKMDECVDEGLDAERSALMLEVAAEAARNPKVAAMIQASDAAVREKLRAVLLGSRQREAYLAADDLDGRIEVLAALIEGFKLRGLRNPELDKDALLRVFRRVVRGILEG